MKFHCVNNGTPKAYATTIYFYEEQLNKSFGLFFQQTIVKVCFICFWLAYITTEDTQMKGLETLLMAPIALAIGTMALTMNAGISLGVFGVSAMLVAGLSIISMFA